MCLHRRGLVRARFGRSARGCGLPRGDALDATPPQATKKLAFGRGHDELLDLRREQTFESRHRAFGLNGQCARLDQSLAMTGGDTDIPPRAPVDDLDREA